MSEHCETANAAMDQAIPGLVADIASGRAEDSMLFVKKLKKYHAAAGGSGFH
ncbi:MAG: hypothetical protein ACLFVO_01275 [Chloroflexaceae bacterium]